MIQIYVFVLATNNTEYNKTYQNPEPKTYRKSQKKIVPGPFPKTYSKKVPKWISKSDFWGHQNRYHQNRAQSLSDSPPGLIPKLKRGLKAIQGGPGTSKESPGWVSICQKGFKIVENWSRKREKYTAFWHKFWPYVYLQMSFEDCNDSSYFQRGQH